MTLQDQLSHLNSERHRMRRDQSQVSKRLRACEDEIKRLEQLLKDSHHKVVVSDSALLQYVEKVYGINLDRIRQSILLSSLASELSTKKFFERIPVRDEDGEISHYISGVERVVTTIEK